MSIPWRAHAAGLLLILGAGLLLAGAGPTLVATPLTNPDLRLATTRRLAESGLLTILLADFQAQTHYNVAVNALEAGQALALGAQGSADVLLVDAPAAEQVFVQAGAGLDRRLVMHDDFVLLGPPTDPAHAAGQPVGAALRAIGASGATFVSRRDGSDANRFELQLWQDVMGRDVQHEGWYVSVIGDGAATLREAARRNAYTLADRATYLAGRNGLRLRVALEGDTGLRNPYHVIRVNPQRAPKANAAGAQAFADYLLSPAAQQRIAAFRDPASGQALFTPDAGQPDLP